MEIGDVVIYRGRRYVLRGIEPMSVHDRRAQLVDPLTGSLSLAPLAELEPEEPRRLRGPGGFGPGTPG